MSTISLG